MKVSRTQVAENRQKILQAAARLFRERGIAGVNVAEIMDAAGLTHGAFYGYFDSKDDLVAEALRQALAASESLFDAGRARYIEDYLSARHRDDPGTGCVFAALVTEASRQPKAVREVLTSALTKQLDRLGRTGGGNDQQRRRAAIADLSAMVGAMALSRLVDEPKLSAEILAATRDYLEPES